MKYGYNGVQYTCIVNGGSPLISGWRIISISTEATGSSSLVPALLWGSRRATARGVCVLYPGEDGGVDGQDWVGLSWSNWRRRGVGSGGDPRNGVEAIPNDRVGVSGIWGPTKGAGGAWGGGLAKGYGIRGTRFEVSWPRQLTVQHNRAGFRRWIVCGRGWTCGDIAGSGEWHGPNPQPESHTGGTVWLQLSDLCVPISEGGYPRGSVWTHDPQHVMGALSECVRSISRAPLSDVELRLSRGETLVPSMFHVGCTCP